MNLNIGFAGIGSIGIGFSETYRYRPTLIQGVQQAQAGQQQQPQADQAVQVQQAAEQQQMQVARQQQIQAVQQMEVEQAAEDVQQENQRRENRKSELLIRPYKLLTKPILLPSSNFSYSNFENSNKYNVLPLIFNTCPAGGWRSAIRQCLKIKYCWR